MIFPLPKLLGGHLSDRLVEKSRAGLRCLDLTRNTARSNQSVVDVLLNSGPELNSFHWRKYEEVVRSFVDLDLRGSVLRAK